MRLTLRRSDMLGDWYVIERAEHDGREWFEETGPHSSVLRCSARISDADVEGYGVEMLAIADAIGKRGRIAHKRCAVDATHETVKFWSPRNSRKAGECTIAEADELAAIIRATVKEAGR